MHKRNRAAELARHRLDRTYLRTAGDFAEVVVNPLFRLFKIDIACNHHSSVVGTIPLFIKFFNVTECGRLQILQAADYLPVVRVISRIHSFVNHIAGMAIRLIVHTLPLFILDNLLLVFQYLLCDGIDHIPHTVALHPQNALECILGHDLVVDGPVVPGTAVELTAGIIDNLKKIAFAYIF